MKLQVKAEGIAIYDNKGFLSIKYNSFSESIKKENEYILEGNVVTTHLVKMNQFLIFPRHG